MGLVHGPERVWIKNDAIQSEESMSGVDYSGRRGVGEISIKGSH